MSDPNGTPPDWEPSLPVWTNPLPPLKAPIPRADEVALGADVATTMAALHAAAHGPVKG